MGDAEKLVGMYDSEDRPEPLFYPAWCKANGEVRVGLADFFEDAYEHYCSNPHGFSDHEFRTMQWRGVFKLGELMDCIAAIR